MPYLDALVPPEPDPRDLLERLRKRGIRDSGTAVVLGPLDQATLNLVRAVVTATPLNMSLELPRGRNDVAVLLGIYLQLMRLGARFSGRLGRESFTGPVVVVGLNVNLTERLRQIKIGPESLSEALQAQRIRADGTVTDLRGVISPASAWSEGLLYLNTSLGWPTLPGVRPGIVIVDRASFRNSETLDRALAWCAGHEAARIVVLGTLGDPPPPALTDTATWLRWAWTPGMRCEVRHELGDEPACGLLSTNALLAAPPRRVAAALYTAPELTRLRRSCLAGIAAARKLRQPFPMSVARTVQLVNLLAGLWGRVETANIWAVADPRGASAAMLERSVRGAHDQDLIGPWSGFRETEWPDLRRNALLFAELIKERNPRLDMLTGVLDWAAGCRPDARIVVRTQTRSSAGALAQDLRDLSDRFTAALGDGDPGTAQLSVLPYSDRLPWTGRAALELHLGVPAPWRRSALVSGEASEHLVVVDPDEAAWLNTVVEMMDDEWAALIRASAEALGLTAGAVRHLGEVRRVFGPVAVDTRGEQDDGLLPPLPALDLSRLFAAFSSAVTQVDRGDEDNERDVRTPAGGKPTLARQIVLEPGETVYWLPCDGRTDVLFGTKYASIPVASLSAGMSLLIPRGETRDDLYARLLRTAHSDADVMAVTTMLHRFRTAVRRLHEQEGSWDAVGRKLHRTGATCRAWATGEVIAPDDVSDIRRVGWLTNDVGLTLDNSWERLGAIADELRRLHRELGRLLSAAIAEAASGRAGPNLQRLSGLCGGIDTMEILEEFEVRIIQAVHPAASVPSSQLRRLISV